MTSKEALELLELILNNHSVMLEVDDNRMECLNVIKQDLERLEVLEKENQKLLVNKNVAQALAIKYKKVIEILKRNLVIEFNDDLHFVHLKEDISQTCDYTIIDIEDKQEYELLKGVMNNEI